MRYSFVTSFNKEGYALYGQAFLASYMRHAAQDSPLTVVLEGFETPPAEQAAHISYIDIASPALDDFLARNGKDPKKAGKVIDPQTNKSRYEYRFDAMRFVKKVFALTHTDLPVMGFDWRIWIDADTLLHAPIDAAYFDRKLSVDKDVYYLGRQDWDNTESGFVAYNLRETRHGRSVLSTLRFLYERDKIFRHPQWADGPAFDVVRTIAPAHILYANIAEGVAGRDVWEHTWLAEFSIHNKGARKYTQKPAKVPAPPKTPSLPSARTHQAHDTHNTQWQVYSTGHKINERITQAFAQGLRHPAAPVARYQEDAPEHDQNLAVVHGILRGSDRIIKARLARKQDFLHIDNGYFGHRHFDGYYRVTKNQLQTQYLPKRPIDRWQKLGLRLEPWRKDGKALLVCPMSDFVAKFLGLDANQWLSHVLRTLSEHSDRQIIVRYKHCRESLLEQLKNTHALIGYQTLAGIDALLFGVPVFMLGPSALCSNLRVALDNLTEIEDPLYPDHREEWASALAYQQFSLEEMQNGTAKTILQELLHDTKEGKGENK
ncbi:MAG: hypothetical protein AAF352_02865 [Pseudomonadota bacterium]